MQDVVILNGSRIAEPIGRFSALPSIELKDKSFPVRFQVLADLTM